MARVRKTEDQEHLKLLAIGHYVVGGIGVFFACLPLIHLTIGLVFLFGDGIDLDTGEEVPAFIGVLFAVIGGMMFLFGQACAWCVIYSGRQIAQRKKHTFSFIIGCVNCMFFPFGTILGVFTIIVLSRDSVKALYDPLDGQTEPEFKNEREYKAQN